MKRKQSHRFFLLLFVLVTLFVLILSILANKVFMFQPYAYTVDELADLNLIYKLYSISNLKEFLSFFLVYNPDPYHGLITFLIPGFLSYIPYKIGGEPYLLFSLRMSSAIFIISSYLFLVAAFFNKIQHRFFFYLILLLLPYTNMFILWPRCESYQYFFLSLFFYFQKKYSWNKLWPFLFLGLSIGSRISSAPYAIAIFCCLLFFEPTTISTRLKNLAQSIAMTVAGFSIAVPHVLYPPNTYAWILGKQKQMFDDTGMDTTLTFSKWLKFAIPYYTGSGIYLFITISLLIISTVIVFWFMKTNKIKPTRDEKRGVYISLSLGWMGLMCFLGIMFKIKIATSYWYLQQHYIFFLLAILVPLSYIKNSVAKKIFLLFFTYLVGISVAFCFEKSPYFKLHPWNFSRAIRRASTKMNLRKEKNYQEVTTKLKEISIHLNRQIFVRVLADIWQPRSNEFFKIEAEWSPSPFRHFESENYTFPEIIVVNTKLYYPPSKLLENFQEGERKVRENGYKLYNQFLCKSDLGESLARDCYTIYRINDDYSLLYNKKLNLKSLK